MNLKSTSLGILSVSLLMQSSLLFAASKNPQLEIKNLQSSLVKNKNAIDNLLSNRAHVITKELESTITSVGIGYYSNKTTLSQAIRTVIHSGIESEKAPENLLAGSDAITNLLSKTYRMSSDDKQSKITNPDEKIYSITVISPEQLTVLKQANERVNATFKGKDNLVNQLSRYINLSVKANRYLTYKEANALTNQIAKMNNDVQDLEELIIELPLKDQTVVNNFKRSMDEWLNKKLVFQKLAKDGFQMTLSNDYSVGLTDGSYINGLSTVRLERDYSAQNVADRLRNTIHQIIAESDYGTLLHNGNKKPALFERTNQVLLYPDLQSLKVTVNGDLKSAVISTNKFSMPVPLAYYQISDFTISKKDKEIYNRGRVLAASDYNNQGLEKRILDTHLDEGSEISMRNINKNSGFDIFGDSDRKVEFKEIAR